jgi:hypothetical protein
VFGLRKNCPYSRIKLCVFIKALYNWLLYISRNKTKNLSVLGYDALLVGESFPTYSRIVFLLSLGVRQLAIQEELYIKMKAVQFFAVLDTTHLATQYYIPGNLNSQQHSENLCEGYHCFCLHNKISFNILLSRGTPYVEFWKILKEACYVWYHLMNGLCYLNEK